MLGPHAKAAQGQALGEIREFLRGTEPRDFTDAEDFADALYQVIETAFRTTFEKDAAKAIKNATKASYGFFRLKDETPFGETGSPVQLKFGAPDKRAIRFFDSVDKWYFSKFMRNDDAARPLRKFLREEYLEKGAALFGRETPESLDDFRQAAGEKLKNLTDFQIKRIVSGSVARIRNWAHVGSMHQAEFELARYVAVLDARTTEICRHIDGKMIRVGTAQQRITELTKLEPGEFALELYESTAAREYQKNPVAWIEKRTTNNIVDDDALKQNIGLPPLHILCRTRMEGVFEELEDGGVEPTPAPDAPEPDTQELSAADARAKLAGLQASYAERLETADSALAKASLRAYGVTGPRAEVLLEEIARLRNERAELAQARLKEMHDTVAVNAPSSFEVEFQKRVGRNVKAVVQEGVALFQRLVGGDFLTGRKLSVKHIGSRAYHSGGVIAITPRNDAATVVHEIGHWLEQSSTEILERITDFYERRTKDEKEQSLASVFPTHSYRRDERTKKDDFFHAYMGKVYRDGRGRIRATEIVSMGLEQFARDPWRLAQHDPEMFDLIYEIARLKKTK